MIFKLLLFLLLFFFFHHPANAFSQSTYLITDLEGTTEADFANEANAWTASNQVSPSLATKIGNTTCNMTQQMVLGGPNVLGPASSNTYNQYFERNYQNVQYYQSYMAVEFYIWAFYSTVQTTLYTGFFEVQIDGNTPSSGLTEMVSYQNCEANYTDANGLTTRFVAKYRYRAYIYHYYSTMSIRIVSRLSTSSDIQSFGFKNLKLYLHYSVYNSGSMVISENNFPCYYNLYWDGNSCANCHQYCKSCYGTTKNQCYDCYSGYYNYGNSTCDNDCPVGPLVPSTSSYPYTCYRRCPSGQFYWAHNQSCTTTCDFPLVNFTDNNNLPFCASPCALNTFLYPNGSCFADCLYPLKQYVDTQYVYICQNPCLPYTTPTPTYLYTNRSCMANCPFPLSIRSIPSIDYCYNPCNPTTEFLYENGTCITKCESPLVIHSEPDVQYCRNPCLAFPSPSYLFFNRSCINNCPFPLLTRSVPNVDYCYNPCNPTTEYLFENGSCLSQCKAPLRVQIEPGVQYCRNPCYGTNDFLYPDGSCNSTCPLPLFNRTEPGVSYCENPCSVNNTFLHSNQVCKETCPEPNHQRNESIANFCIFPCANFAYYYFTQNGKCQAKCPYPYEATDSPLPKICASSLSEEEVKQIQKMADTTDTANSASSTGALIWSIISSSDSTSACMGPISKMLQYIKFMDIDFSEKVQLMLLQQHTKAKSGGGFSKKMMNDVFDEFPEHDLPGTFHTFKVNTSFFVNFWPALFNLSVILLVTLLFMLLAYNTKKNTKINGILTSIVDILKWNVILVTFCGTLGDVVLYTALELRSMQFEGPTAVFSFMLCLIINILAIVVIVKILEVNLNIRRSKQKVLGHDQEKQKKLIEQQWTSYKALFECYKDYSYYQQIFLFVFIIRLVLFNAIIGYLYNYPLFQAISITVINFLMLMYLVFKRPMKKLINLVQQIILELVLLPFNICVLTIAIMDKQELEEVARRKTIGNIIVYINLMIPLLSLILMALKFIAIGIDVYKQWKLRKSQKNIKEMNLDVSRNTSTLNLTQEKLPFEHSINKTTFTMEQNSQIFDMTPQNYNINLSPFSNVTQCPSPFNSSPTFSINVGNRPRPARGPIRMMQKPSLVMQRSKPNNFIPNVEKMQKRVPKENLIMPDFSTKPSRIPSSQMIIANEMTTIEASIEEIQMNEMSMNENIVMNNGGLQLEPEIQVQSEGKKMRRKIKKNRRNEGQQENE